MPQENLLTLDHQGGTETLRLTAGGFCIQDRRLAISIETENMDDEGWPPCALFCISNYPVTGALAVGDTFDCAGDTLTGAIDTDGATQGRAYFSFHADKVQMRWTVVELRRSLVVFDLEATHDDVNYYGGRAKMCRSTGRFALAKMPLKELWNPD